MIAVLGVFGGRVPPGAESLLASADVVAGGRTVVEAMSPAGARQIALGADLATQLPALAAERGSVVVLASGDPGFFGIVRALSAAVGRDQLDVRPAPSSVAVAFARIGMPWDDAVVVSAHGRDPRPAVAIALRHPKVAVLTEPRATAADLIEALSGSGRQITVAEALGTPAERLRSGTAESLAGQSFGGPNVVLVYEDGPVDGRAVVFPPRTPDRWALPDDAFEHRGGMITKAEVRAVALAALGPGTGDLVWDIGCGSGAVAIECARLGAAVIGIDKDAEAVDFSARNAAAYGVPVRVVHGAAPDALAGLPDPDATFLGGGGVDLEAILAVAVPRTKRAVVVTVAIIERVGPALAALAEHGLEVEAATLQASRLRPIAGGHRLAPENPVTVIAGRRP